MEQFTFRSKDEITPVTPRGLRISEFHKKLVKLQNFGFRHKKSKSGKYFTIYGSRGNVMNYWPESGKLKIFHFRTDHKTTTLPPTYPDGL